MQGGVALPSAAWGLEALRSRRVTSQPQTLPFGRAYSLCTGRGGGVEALLCCKMLCGTYLRFIVDGQTRLVRLSAVELQHCHSSLFPPLSVSLVPRNDTLLHSTATVIIPSCVYCLFSAAPLTLDPCTIPGSCLNRHCLKSKLFVQVVLCLKSCVTHGFHQKICHSSCQYHRVSKRYEAMFVFPNPEIVTLLITFTVVRDVVRKEYGCGLKLTTVMMIKMVVIGEAADGCKSDEF